MKLIPFLTPVFLITLCLNVNFAQSSNQVLSAAADAYAKDNFQNQSIYMSRY